MTSLDQAEIRVRRIEHPRTQLAQGTDFLAIETRQGQARQRFVTPNGRFPHMPAPRQAPAPATPRPSPAEIAIAEIIAASAESDHAATALAVALSRRREAIQRLQRLHVYPAPSLLSKLISARLVDSGLAAAGVTAFASLYVSANARKSFGQMADDLFRRFRPTTTTEEAQP